MENKKNHIPTREDFWNAVLKADSMLFWIVMNSKQTNGGKV